MSKKCRGNGGKYGNIDLKDKHDCPLNELFPYLNEESEKASYVCAQIIIKTNVSDEEETEEFEEDSEDRYRQDIVKMELTIYINYGILSLDNPS